MPDGSTRLAISPFRIRNRLPLIMQAEATECALACLAMIATYHGLATDLPTLRRKFSTSLKGVSLARVIEVAAGLGLEARGLRVEPVYLEGLRSPCILHWDMNHFVVLSKVTRKGFVIFDPARGVYTITREEASGRFTGVMLEVGCSSSFKPTLARQRVSLRALTGRIVGLIPLLAQVFGLALCIEVLGLCLPFQMQWMLDEALVSRDVGLVALLAAGFLVVLGVQTGLNLVRAWIITWFGATLEAQWTCNLFSHLLKLPLDYFEKRHMGDVVSRFGSLRTIRGTLTGSFVQAVLDGGTATFAAILLFFYNGVLAAVALATTAIYIAFRCLYFKSLRRFNEEQLIQEAKQQTSLIESVRGVVAIKLANRQGVRKSLLAGATYSAAERAMRKERVALAFSSVSQGLFGAQRILLVAIGAWLAIKSNLTAGMVVAAVAFADQFTVRVGGLVDKLVEFQLLRLHAERLADIALTEPERHAESNFSGPDPSPEIEVRNLGFRYSLSESWVFRGLNLRISAGESVALVGPSGCGKSTLAKVLLGLLVAEEGEVLVGGIPLSKLGHRRFRDLIAAVNQDDHLFAGSIAENISFNDPDAAMADVVEAARAAAIHEEICAMPMGYETLVGDMGSVMSGGQRQRLLIARALYRRPKIVLLDEATSHLDGDNCRRIDDQIASLNMTRIIIAHRQETIDSAQRVVHLAGIQN